MTSIAKIVSAVICIGALVFLLTLASQVFSSDKLAQVSTTVTQDIMQFEFGVSGLIFTVLALLSAVKRANLMAKSNLLRLDALWTSAFLLLVICLTDAMSALTFVVTNSTTLYYTSVALLFVQCGGMVLIVLYLQFKMGNVINS